MTLLLALVFLQAPVGALGEPPVDREAPEICVCPRTPVADVPTIYGFAIDAVVLLDASGLKPLPRQATIFRIVSAEGVEAATPFKVWHLSGANRCGVDFDYGKGYTVALRQKGADYETDICLMRQVEETIQ